MSYNPRDKAQNWLPGYVRAVADRFGLKDWEFEITSESSDDDSAMSVFCVENRRYALLKVSDHFWDGTPKKQRHYVCHELAHCHTWPAMDYAESCMSVTEKDVLRRFDEMSVDAIASAIAPFMPLPPRPAKPAKKKIKNG